MFLVLDKHYGRIVKRATTRQEAIDFALKSSKLGGRQFVLAEVIGETRQVTESRFFETNEVQVGYEPTRDQLRPGVRQGQPDEICPSGNIAGAEFRYQWDPVVQSPGSPAAGSSDTGGSGTDSEST